MIRPPHTASGFSLVELSVASLIMVVALSISMAGFRYAMRGSSQNSVQNELDMDVQTSMEHLKYDLRLTSLSQIFFYPEGPGPYSAISFPQAVDTDGDGALQFSGDSLVWNRTCVYHVWQGQPYQLRKTVFEPYDSSLTAAQRQMQLNSVVTNGNGLSTYGADHTTTQVIFQNLFKWQVTSIGSSQDCYEALPSRRRVQFGSIVLDTGAHTFRFEVIGKNNNSSGRKIGIDTLFVSPSYGPREGEAQLPPSVQVGVAAQRDYMANGSWSGNYQLGFPATVDGHYFELSLENDRWEETNFDGDDSRFSDAKVVFDQTLVPMDFVVRLDGLGTNWSVVAQTGETNLSGYAAADISDCVVRVPIRGADMLGGGWITASGRRCKFGLKAGSGDLGIQAAFIVESASSLTNTMDTTSATPCRITFGGANGVTIPAGTTAWSDLADYPIDRTKSYMFSFYVYPWGGHGSTVMWRQSGSVPAGCYMVRSPSFGEFAARQANWSARLDVVTTNVVFALESMYATYPATGSFQSQACDTQVTDPQYQTIAWNSSEPSGTAISMFIRSANSNNMSDATDWTNLSAVAQGGINPGAKRYVQFKSVLTSNNTGVDTPLLKDVTVRWAGPKRGVDVGAVLTKGPDQGIVRVSVDGKPLTSALQIELEIFKDARGFKGAKTMTSSLRQEIMPRNSR